MNRFTLYAQLLRSRGWRAVLACIVVVGMAAGAFVVSGTSAQAAGSLPCDLYAAAGTSCVAAHSTTRALLSAYSGNLYQVKRWSDSATTNIGTLAAGGNAQSGSLSTWYNGAEPNLGGYSPMH